MATQENYRVVTSFWGTAEPVEGSELVGDQEADVVVVGAGLAGLSTAYHLAKAGASLEIAVLEARYAGYGPSGRNFCNVPQLARSDLTGLVRVLGPDNARYVVEHQERMLGDFEQLLVDEAIECEFVLADILLAALHEEMMSGLKRMHEQHERYNFPSELLDAEAVASYVNLSAYGGLSCSRNGYAQPFKLSRGLRDAAIRLGVVVHEASPLRSLRRDGSTVVARSDRGSVRARSCVLATGAYGPAIGAGKGVLHPTYTYALATEPLDQESIAQMRWHPRHRLIMDAGLNYYYMQLRPDGQFLMGGGGRPPVSRDNVTIPPHDDAAEFSRIHTEMLTRFPWLQGKEIACAWGGPLDMTESSFPITAEVAPGIFLNAGYNGRGMLMAALSGRVLAGEVLGDHARDPDYARYAEILLRRDAGRVTVAIED